VFPVRYELNFYILFRWHSVLKGLICLFSWLSWRVYNNFIQQNYRYNLACGKSKRTCSNFTIDIPLASYTPSGALPTFRCIQWIVMVYDVYFKQKLERVHPLQTVCILLTGWYERAICKWMLMKHYIYGSWETCFSNGGVRISKASVSRFDLLFNKRHPHDRLYTMDFCENWRE
jgi:hypothetical protein